MKAFLSYKNNILPFPAMAKVPAHILLPDGKHNATQDILNLRHSKIPAVPTVYPIYL